MHHFGSPPGRDPQRFRPALASRPRIPTSSITWLRCSCARAGRSSGLHRRILLSHTYRQASEDRPECRKVDPENSLLWRMNRQRLDFEAMRDALLAVSDRLDPVIGGPSASNLVAPDSKRRTLYGFIDRLNLPGLYRTFDFPDPNATSPKRDGTTIAPQALFLMNHPFVRQAARGVLGRPEVASEPVARAGASNACTDSSTAAPATDRGAGIGPRTTWAQTHRKPSPGNAMSKH